MAYDGFDVDSANLVCVLAGIGMLAGCDGDSEAPSPPTYVYVVSSLSLPVATPDPDGPAGPMRRRAAGFDIDGLDSGDGSMEPGATCEELHQDFAALTDNDHFGVDNAFQGLVGTIEGLLEAADCPGMTTEGCLDAFLQQQISEGSLLLLIEVSGVDDFLFEPSVMVQLHVGATADGMPPATESDGTVSPGQAFVSTMVLGPAVDAEIFFGRLAVRAGVLPLFVDLGDFELDLVIARAQVRFDISGTSLTRGAIGGVVTVDSMVPPGGDRSVLESIADVNPGIDPTICEEISLGLLFRGTSATLN